MAEISEDGQILVENHYVGCLDGFCFTPDSSSDGIHGKAARHAAAQVLATELANRAAALVAASDESIALTPQGRIVWQGSQIGQLARGETALKPRIDLFVDEHLSGPDRERIATRLDAWLAAYLQAKLNPLVALSEAEDLTGLARGLAFRLTETLGVLRRDSASDEIKALDQADRGQLRKYGVRFGAFNLYFPVLLKPAAAELLLLLWVLHAGHEHGLDADGLPERPRQGLTSVAADGTIPEPYWRAAGFHVAGNRAVRIDMLERLSDLIRMRIAWRPAENGAEVSPPTGATGDGGFRAVSELMSIVGCSGEEFASILRALGFRLERRKLETGNGAADPAKAETVEGETSTPEPAPVEPADAAPSDAAAPAEPPTEPAFDEIWRPGRRKDIHHAHQGTRSAKEKRPGRGKQPPHRAKSQRKGKGADRRQEKGQEPRQHRQPRRERMNPEHSPFAALKELRDALARERPEGS